MLSSYLFLNYNKKILYNDNVFIRFTFVRDKSKNVITKQLSTAGSNILVCHFKAESTTVSLNKFIRIFNTTQKSVLLDFLRHFLILLISI